MTTISFGSPGWVIGEREFFIKRALGSHVWDNKDRRYMDLTSGWNVVNAGWNNPEILDALRSCAETLPFKPSWCFDIYSTALVETLSGILPGYIPIAGCSGADGIDNALKVVRLVTGRPGVISFAGAYHGSSTGAALATGYEVSHLDSLGLPHRQVSLPFVTTDEGLLAVEQLVRSTEDAGAIVFETVLTNAGCFTLSEEYLNLLRSLADEHDLLLVCDEIGTGFGRTGKVLSHAPALKPDIVVLGKALTNGLYPLSLCMVSKDLVGFLSKESFLSTFAGAPLGCAAAIASINYHTRHDLASKAASNGVAIRKKFEETLSGCELIVGLHGCGLELAVHFDWTRCRDVGLTPCELIRHLKSQDVFATLSTDSQLMIIPPLIAETTDLLSAMDVIIDVIRSYS